MSSIDISVIVVSNNHQHYLERCLTSLAASDGPFQVKVIVVDNASDDDTVGYVRTNFPQVTLIVGEVKRGFSANNNLALRHTEGRYVLLINPDTEVTSDALNRLIRYMDDHPDVGICGPQLRFPDKTVQLSCRAFPTWRSVLVRRTPLRVVLRNSSFNKQHLMADLDHSLIQDVDWLLGAALMIRREMLDAVGFLDERYFLYVEDIDFCWRAHQAGWRVVYMPEAVIVHHHLAVSDRKFFSKYMYFHFISMLYYFIKYKLPPSLFFVRPSAERLIDVLNALAT